MALRPGTRLGPYEIAAPVGAGGMGEVYRAIDTRLDREVAIKVLPEHFSGSPERRARFHREARVISTLNHPKICTLHDVGEEGGTQYLVMELLEGETLADRIKRGPLPIDQALRLGAEIAEALDAAHRRRLIHRDLKPGNVMLTRTGIKLLDFGLARAIDSPGGDGPEAPTATSPVTTVGTVIGTLQYMAPEQIEGKQADARADIFALGAILYEMITGRRAFHGETQGSLIASILKEEPPPLPDSVPFSQAIERCVLLCLAKDREERWQAAHDLRQELLWVAEDEKRAAAPVPLGRDRSAWWRYMAVATVALIAGLAVGWLALGRRPPGNAGPVYLELSLPMGTSLNGWASPVVAIAPDGGAVAFVADGEDGVAKLYVRELDSAEARLVPESATAEGPFFSPDGNWVGFAVGTSNASNPSGRGGELLKYSLQTRLTQPICSVDDYFGAAWGTDGEILFTNSLWDGLWKVPATGGEPRNILPSFRENGQEVRKAMASPRILPDGRHALLTDAGVIRGRLVVVNLESGELTDLGIQAQRGLFTGGDLFYTDAEGTLFRVPFDASRRATTGAPVALMDEISLTRFAIPVLDIAENETLVYSSGYVRGSRIVPSELVHVDGAGAVTALPVPPQMIYRSIAVSPEGDRLAVCLQDGSIWIHDLDRGTRTKLPSGVPMQSWAVTWSPDGVQIAFSAQTDQGFALMRQRTNGSSGPEVVLSDEVAELYAGAWTPAGDGIVYGHYINRSVSMRVASLEKGVEPRILVDGLPLNITSDLSPDGRWFAYDSPGSGDYDVYVQDMSGSSDRFVVSSGGGNYPRWSADGGTLFYHTKGRIMSVSVPSESGGKFGRPRLVVETDIDPAFSVDPRGGFYGFRPVPDVGILQDLKLILKWKPFDGAPPG